MKMLAHILVVAFLSITSSLVYASDPYPWQDICVADFKSNVLVNGFVCKEIKKATAEDFFFMGLDKPGDTKTKVGPMSPQFLLTRLHSRHLHGSHRLRALWNEPSSPAPPHHRILTVLEGTLYAGFITSNQDNNHLISKILNKGNVFAFPLGLIHFQANIGHTNAVAIATLSSQNPGVITIANSVFGTDLAKAFQVDKKAIDHLLAQFWVAP